MANASSVSQAARRARPVVSAKNALLASTGNLTPTLKSKTTGQEVDRAHSAQDTVLECVRALQQAPPRRAWMATTCKASRVPPMSARNATRTASSAPPRTVATSACRATTRNPAIASNVSATLPTSTPARAAIQVRIPPAIHVQMVTHPFLSVGYMKVGNGCQLCGSVLPGCMSCSVINGN
jgi:hypothetical protein